MFAALFAEAASKTSKGGAIEIESMKVAVDGSKLLIDGQIKNAGERPLEKIVLAFHFFDTGHNPVSTLRLEVEEAKIEPGDEAAVHAGANEPPRSVSVEITASDHGERDIKVLKPGPYPIE